MRIEVNGVSFSIGERVILKNVSASLALGEFVCILGAQWCREDDPSTDHFRRAVANKGASVAQLW